MSAIGNSHINRKLRRSAFTAQQGRCHYCNRRMRLRTPSPSHATLATWDHQIPSCRGGSDERSNLVLCCFECNQRKGEKTEGEFRNERARRKTTVTVTATPATAKGA